MQRSLSKDFRQGIFGRIFLAPATLLALSACAGDMPGLGENSQKITVQDDVFFVTSNATSAVARNYATGFFNQARLIENAGIAIAQATGCIVGTVAKRGEVNVYDATLTCPAPL